MGLRARPRLLRPAASLSVGTSAEHSGSWQGVGWGPNKAMSHYLLGYWAGGCELPKPPGLPCWLGQEPTAPLGPIRQAQVAWLDDERWGVCFQVKSVQISPKSEF